MISSEFALSLKAALDLKPKPQDMLRVLQLIEPDCATIDFSKEPLNFIAPIIHHLFLPALGQVRSTLMKIICEIELNSEESIIEEYQFDKLIALSIDQRPSDQNQSKVDSEKVAAFQCVSILLKYRKYLPKSILRALVSIYNVPNHTYKPLILAYLLEAALVNERIEDIPDITTIFMNAFHETGNKGVISLFDYSAEHKLPFVLVDRFASRLIDPISQYITKSEEELDAPVKAISTLLKSWPSMLRYGFQNNILIDLISCLPHQTNAVIAIFKEVLHLTETKCVTDGFTGLVLYSLIKCGLIEKLNDLASSKPTAAAFLGELLPFVSQSDTKFIDLSSSSYTAKKANTQEEFTLKIRKHAQQSETSGSVTSITNFILPQEYSKWDWTNINKILAVILPHNEAEASSSTTTKFLNQLMDCLSGPYYVTPLDTRQNRTFNMIDALRSFMTLLDTNENLWSVVEKHEGMKKAFEKTIALFQTNDAVPAKCGCAVFFEMISAMMCKPRGIAALKNMGMVDKLKQLCGQTKNKQNIGLILSLLKLEPNSISIEIFRGFLLSGDAATQQIALEIIREKRKTHTNFVECVFKPLVIPHLKQSLEQEQMNAALNLVAELCLNDLECRKVVAQDKEAIDVISKKSRLTLAQFFSCEELFQKVDVNAEINFWLETGCQKYVKIFDAAVELFYKSQEEQKTHNPSIIFINGQPQIPCHLFAELAKTSKGLEFLKPVIPQILEMIKSKKTRERRAGFFSLAHIASSPLADEITESQDFGEILFKSTKSSDSFIVYGTLINCLSLFHMSHYLSSLLSRHNWQYFNFGHRYCVLPVEPIAFVGEEKKVEPVSVSMPEIPGEEENSYLLKRLTSKISFNKAKEAIKVVFKQSPQTFKRSEFSLFGNELMANYSVLPDARFFIEVLFKDTPVLALSNEPVDPKAYSHAAAKFMEAIVAMPTVLSYSEVTVTQIPLEKCKQLGRTNYADAFLSDDDFKKVAGIDKDAFYALSEDERKETLKKFA